MTSARGNGHHSSSGRSGKSKNDNIGKVILPKRRRLFASDKKNEMDKLFDKISNDPFYENELPTHNGQSTMNDLANEEEAARKQREELENQHLFLNDKPLDWHYIDHSDGDADDYTMPAPTTELHNLFDQDQVELVKEALHNTNDTKGNGVNYRFFKAHCKLPTPSLINEANKIKDHSALQKYSYLLKNSSDAKRKLLLSSGMLPLWYQHGWNCPHSLYQWLMEVVAFDKDLLSAKQAMTILSTFWSNLPTVKLPLHPAMSDDVNYARNMSVETFSHIMKSYGALKLPTIHKDDDHNNDEQDVTATPNSAIVFDDTVPLIQLEWTLQLLTKSLLLWPEAYTTPQLHYLAKILLGIGMDGLGGMILQTLQDCLRACVLALPQDTWQQEIRQLGCSLCDTYYLVELETRLTRAINPVCGRCSYLRRVIALASLELSYVKGLLLALNSERQQSPSSPPPPCRPLPSLKLISSHMTSPTSIISRMVAILREPTSIFQQSNPDYRQLSQQIFMLDYAIGNDYTELMNSVENVNALVTQLQALGRRIGGRLGVLDRTKANEATQRLWTRLAYMIHQHRKGVADDENL